LVFVKGEIVVEKKSKNKIYNIESWTDAFLIFSSIYGAAHLESYPDLLKYYSNLTKRIGLIQIAHHHHHHPNVTCYRNDIPDKLFTWCLVRITHSA
jgi:hypothetical protein